jgi:hypothetical protein
VFEILNLLKRKCRPEHTIFLRRETEGDIAAEAAPAPVTAAEQLL